jgi:hypothetical protein
MYFSAVDMCVSIIQQVGRELGMGLGYSLGSLNQSLLWTHAGRASSCGGGELQCRVALPLEFHVLLFVCQEGLISACHSSKPCQSMMWCF